MIGGSEGANPSTIYDGSPPFSKGGLREGAETLPYKEGGEIYDGTRSYWPG